MVEMMMGVEDMGCGFQPSLSSAAWTGAASDGSTTAQCSPRLHQIGVIVAQAGDDFDLHRHGSDPGSGHELSNSRALTLNRARAWRYRWCMDVRDLDRFL